MTKEFKPVSLSPNSSDSAIKEDTRHLQVAGHAGFLEKDVTITLGSYWMPCLSVCLSLQSRVLSAMFESTPKETWSAGASFAFSGHEVEDVRLFLAIIHGSGDVKKALDVLRGDGRLDNVIRIAHRLDAPSVIQSCESYVALNPLTVDCPLRWLSLAGGAGMEGVHVQCATDVLAKILDSIPDGVCRLACLWPSEDWEELSTSDTLMLLQGVVRGCCHIRTSAISAYANDLRAVVQKLDDIADVAVSTPTPPEVVGQIKALSDKIKWKFHYNGRLMYVPARPLNRDDIMRFLA